MKYLQTLLLGLSVAQQATAAPVTRFPDVLGKVLDVAGIRHLRVLPLGASITYGEKSSDGNGYRKSLRDMLTSSGYSVNMIGSRQAGTMLDNDVEGWPGFTIDQVHDKAKQDYGLKPNLVLVNAGTNDCLQQLDTANAPARMENLLNDIFGSVEGVTLVLSGLLLSAQQDECNKALSGSYREIVQGGQAEGKKIVFADMRAGFTKDDMADGIHPNDGGYEKMAKSWRAAIQQAADKGFIPKPPKTDS